jgi:SPP1 gp7 family putative phage head morphogenesis protein
MLIHRIEKRLQEKEIADKYVKMLEDTLERIENKLNAMFVKTNKDGKWSQSELSKYNRDMKLKAQIRAEIKKYKENFHKSLRDDLKNEYIQESLYVQDVLSTSAGIEFDKLPTNAIKTAVIDVEKIAGKTMSEYLSKLGVDLAHRAETEIFQGIALGSNPRVVADRLYKAGTMAKNRANTTVRTWYNSVINQSHISTYKAGNIETVEFLATLDMRTSGVCLAKDGKVYPMDEAPVPPLHPNCRSTLLPRLPNVEMDRKDYKGYILDGRRSRKQLNQISSKVHQAYKNKEITKKELDSMVRVLDKAFRKL